MLVHAIDPTVHESWLPSSVVGSLYLVEQIGMARQEDNFLDEMPVMLETVLGLDLLLHEPSIDLRMVSDLVLSDVGATIHILELIGREYDTAARQPSRMGDCLASLDVGAWFGAVSARTFACDREHSSTTMIWRHCRLVAQYAQLVAESLDGISSEDAYLVGLLHEIGAIATVLGRPKGGLDAVDPAALVAVEGALPRFVLTAMRGINDICSSSTWRFILAAAHELAGGEMDFDSSALPSRNSGGISSRGRALSLARAESSIMC